MRHAAVFWSTCATVFVFTSAGSATGTPTVAPSDPASGTPIVARAVTPADVARAQLSAPDESRLRVARAIMRAARYCALITQDREGRASARTIDPTSPDSNIVVYFATTPKSRKVTQLSRDDRVSLYYFDATALSYVTLYGRARLVTNAADKRRVWKGEWTPFYPDRERGAAVYAVTPERVEIVSPRDKITGDSVSWAPVTIHFKARPVRR